MCFRLVHGLLVAGVANVAKIAKGMRRMPGSPIVIYWQLSLDLMTVFA